MATVANFFSLVQTQTQRISSRWWFIAGLAGIVILAAGLRLSHADWGLPYIEYGDETHLYFHGQARRGLYDPNYGAGSAYPPLLVWMNVGVQQLMEAQGRPGLAPTIYTLRILAAVANTMTALFVGLAAYLLAGQLAGL